MRYTHPLFRGLALLAVLICSSTLTASAAGISASAILTGTQVSPGVYTYSITLTDTGTTTIGTYWLGWVPGAGFLSAAPSAVSNPAGWSDLITNSGAAIQWTSTTNLLNPGQSLPGFGFTSTETPSQLLASFAGPGTGAGDPDLTSFVYISTPRGDPGFQFVTAAAPEPSSFALLLTGLGGVATFARKRFRA